MCRYLKSDAATVKLKRSDITFPLSTASKLELQQFVRDKLGKSIEGKQVPELQAIVLAEKLLVLEYADVSNANLPSVFYNLKIRGYSDAKLVAALHTKVWDGVLRPDVIVVGGGLRADVEVGARRNSPAVIAEILLASRLLLIHVIYMAQVYHFANLPDGESQLLQFMAQCPPCLLHAFNRIVGHDLSNFVSYVNQCSTGKGVKEENEKLLNAAISKILSGSAEEVDEMLEYAASWEEQGEQADHTSYISHNNGRVDVKLSGARNKKVLNQRAELGIAARKALGNYPTALPGLELRLKSLDMIHAMFSKMQNLGTNWDTISANVLQLDMDE